jgi:hypothetical protein
MEDLRAEDCRCEGDNGTERRLPVWPLVAADVEGGGGSVGQLTEDELVFGLMLVAVMPVSE